MNRKTVITLLVLAALAVLVLAASAHVTIFEDGSWVIGSFPYPMSGCLPWGICN